MAAALTDDQIKSLMRDWLNSTLLDHFERTLVQQLLNAICTSREHWRAVAGIYVAQYENILRSAFFKAQAQGLCRERPPA